MRRRLLGEVNVDNSEAIAVVAGEAVCNKMHRRRYRAMSQSLCRRGAGMRGRSKAVCVATGGRRNNAA